MRLAPIALLPFLACASAPPAPTVECPVCAPPAKVETPAAATGPLIFENTPPIPDTLKAQLQRYLEARSATVASVSDDGSEILVSTRLGSASQIHRLRMPLGDRQQVTFEAEPVTTAAYVPAQNRSFVFVRDVGGNEQYQLYRTDLDSGKTTLITDGKSRQEQFTISEDGATIVFASNARNGKDFDLWMGDARDAAKNRLLLETQGSWQPLQISRDKRSLLVSQYVSITDQRLHLLDIPSGKLTSLTAPTPTSSNREALFARAGKKADRTIYVTSDREGDFVELYEVDLDTNAWTPLTRHLKWDVESVSLAPDGKTLAFVTNEDGFGKLHLLDTATRKEKPAPQIPAGIVTSARFAKKAPILAFTFTGATVNGDAYTYDLRTKELVRWTESEVGGLDPKQFVEPELFRYKTFDGRDIPCFLYKPAGAGPFPVVINIHGGPESQSRPSFSSLAQLLVNEGGMAVLVPNVRGSNGYGKAYLTLDDGKLREDSVKDIGALLDWVGTRKDLDAKSVGVLGGSYGGYMVLASLTHFSDRIKAGVDVVGISNFVTFLENTSAYRRDLRRVEYGNEADPDMRAHLLAISPSTNADKIKSALFLVHGANDPRVPLSEAEQIAAAVKKNGQDVWKLIAMNEGHGFAKRENRDAYIQLTVLFFKQHLGARP